MSARTDEFDKTSRTALSKNANNKKPFTGIDDRCPAGADLVRVMMKGT
jgi:hypothetical protein